METQHTYKISLDSGVYSFTTFGPSGQSSMWGRLHVDTLDAAVAKVLDFAETWPRGIVRLQDRDTGTWSDLCTTTGVAS